MFTIIVDLNAIHYHLEMMMSENAEATNRRREAIERCREES